MNTADRGQPLAGLVSSAAEALYLRLRVSGTARLGTEAGAVDPNAPEIDELLELGLVFRSGDNADLIRPVTPPVALQLLLERRQAEMLAVQRRIIDGWSRLTSLLPRDLGSRSSGEIDGIVLIPDFHEVVTRAAELYATAKRRIRGIETGEFATRPTREWVRTPPPGALEAGTRYQMIYQISCLSSPAGEAIIAASLRGEEEVRLRPRVPLKMLAGAAADGGRSRRRRLNMSITTVRRHVKAIYTALGVDSRFAAGAAAAKRGWI